MKRIPNPEPTLNDNDKIKGAEKKLAQTQANELKKVEEGLNKNSITGEITDSDPQNLLPHPVNLRLYGHEKVELRIVRSILKFGQFTPVDVIKDEKPGLYTIISGHSRVEAIKYINEKELQRLVPRAGSSKNYDEDTAAPFTPMEVIIRILDLPDEQLRILKLIDYNIFREKVLSQRYNESQELHKIYDPEGEIKRNRELLQFAVSSDLKKRFRKPAGCKINDKDYYGALFNNGEITEDDVRGSIRYIKACENEKLDTLQKIGDTVGIPPTNLYKLEKIGKLAYEDHDSIGIAIMKRLDLKIWSINNAYNVYKLKDFQNYFTQDSDVYKRLNDDIQKVLNVSTTDKKNRDSLVKDSDVKKYQSLIDEIKLTDEKKKTDTNDKSSAILIEPNDFPVIDEKFDISASSNAVLFIIPTKDNLAGCLTLMEKVLKFTYRTFDFFEDKLLLMGTNGEYFPEMKTDKIGNRDELYAKIIEFCPSKYYHEVPNRNTPEVEPPGWEIPIGKDITIRQSLENKKHAIEQLTKAAKKANVEIKILNEAHEKNKYSKKTNSKKKLQNSINTSNSTENNQIA